jgi:hypothetical protein
MYRSKLRFGSNRRSHEPLASRWRMLIPDQSGLELGGVKC